jgi:hypothetical protein
MEITEWLWLHCNKNSQIHKQINEAYKNNINSSSSTSYTVLAVYTSRLLDFKKLPEPKNADNNDNLFGIEYSGIKIYNSL